MALYSVILSGQQAVEQEGSRAAPLPADLGSSSTAQLLSQESPGRQTPSNTDQLLPTPLQGPQEVLTTCPAAPPSHTLCVAVSNGFL